MVRKLRVAMIAPPWLSIPAKSFGGTEAIIAHLVTALRQQHVEVDLFTIGESTQAVPQLHSYEDEQYVHIHKRFEESGVPPAAHMLVALNQILERPDRYDIIHDHNMHTGPLALRWATELAAMPPAIHTIHGAYFTTNDTISKRQPDYTPLWEGFSQATRAYAVGISHAQMKDAPRALRPRTLPVVYNGINVDDFEYTEKKQDYFITLARMVPSKGIAIAAKLCNEAGYRLKMAGSIDEMGDSAHVKAWALAPDDGTSSESRTYFRQEIMPYLAGRTTVEYVGAVSGISKRRLIAGARALLFPIVWDEPFGVAVIEALASGTPVIAMNRGAMPELIEHGVTGFLANNEAEFRLYMERIGEIQPRACQQAAAALFSREAMAAAYIKRYEDIIAKDRS